MIEAFFQKNYGVLQPARTVGEFQLEHPLRRPTEENVLYLASTKGGASVVVKISQSPDPAITQIRENEVLLQNEAADTTRYVVPVVAAGREHLFHSVNGEGDFFFSVTPFFPDGTMKNQMPSLLDPNMDLMRKDLILYGFFSVCLAAAEFGMKGKIVNRDINIQNALMRNGWGHSTDFRTAIRTGEREKISGLVHGTPSAISPEQVMGRVETFDHRTDVWYLAAMLLNIWDGGPLTNATLDNPQPAYDALHSPLALEHHLDTRLSDVPFRLQDSIRWGLSYYPSGRPTSLHLYNETRKAIERPNPPTIIFTTSINS